MINVVHEEKNGNVYANIAGASPLPKGMTAPELNNEKAMIDVNTSSLADIDGLPDFLKEKIRFTDEFAGRLKHEDNMAKLNRPNIVKGAIEAKEKREEGLVHPTEDINPDDVPF